MQHITSGTGLTRAIQLLEAEQAAEGQRLKEQFNQTYQSFSPGNLLKANLRNAVSSPDLIQNVIIAGMGLATGYFTKNIVAGASSFLIRKLVSRLVVRHMRRKTPKPTKP